MEAHGWSSAVSRCPTEVWGMILAFATYLPMRGLESDAWLPSRLLNGEVVTPKVALWRDQNAGLAAMQILRLVCRAWCDLLHSTFLKWVVIREEASLGGRALQMHESVRGLLRGETVRQLSLLTDTMDTPAESEHALNRILQACSRLEEYHMMLASAVDGHRLTQTLVSSCGATLEVMLIARWNKVQLSLDDYVHLLEGCKRLHSLCCVAENTSFVRAASCVRHAGIDTIGLRDLTWRMRDETTAPLFDLLAKSQLGYLRRVKIIYHSKELNLEERPQGYIPPGLSSFFQSHGAQLLSIHIEPGSSAGESGLAFAILDLCSRVEDFVFSLESCKRGSVVHPHNTLRRLGCQSVFTKFEEQHIVAEHVAKVLEIIETFCGPGFPSLCIIRGMDIEPSTPWSRYRQEKYGDFPDEYRVLICKVASRCGSRNIRFEDCLGELVKLDFTPGGVWWQLRDTLGTSSIETEEEEE